MELNQITLGYVSMYEFVPWDPWDCISESGCLFSSTVRIHE